MSVNILTSGSRLPSEYQEVEYIESSGTQYIDTLSEIYNTTKIKLTIALDSISGDQKFFGSYGGDGICLGVYDNKWRFGSNMWESSSLSTEATTDKTVIEASGTSWSFNGVNCTATTPISASTYTMSICAIKFLGSIFQYGNIKVYEFEIYDDGVNLSKHFIPCYRRTDNEIGLYDIVNGVFYTNDGTGTFAKGNNVYAIKSCKINIIEQNPNSHNLPNTYQEVEYITSEGHQYLDTQFIPNQDTRVKTKVYITGGNGSYPGPYGANAGNWNNKSYSTAFGASTTYDEYNNDIQIGGSYRNQLIEIDKNKNVLYFNGTTMRTHNQATFTPSVSMYVFAINWNDEPSQYIAGNMYYLQVYDDSTLVRDFVPCYRKSDNAIGMYDLLNSGKNLFDLASITARNSSVKLKKLNGNITITNNNSYAINGLNGWYITLDAGTYTMSIAEAISNSIAVYNADTDRWISNGIYHGNTSGTFTLTETTRIYFNVLLAQGVTETIKHLQLEKNNSATSYEPYPFYANIGSGTFSKGADVTKYILKKIKPNILTHNPNLLNGVEITKI